MDEWIGKIIENVDLKKTLVVITSDHGSEVGDYTEKMDEYNEKNLQIREHKYGIFYKISHKIILSFPSFFSPLRKKLSRMYSKRAFDNTMKRLDPEFERVKKLDLRPYEKRTMLASTKSAPGLYDERFKIPLLFFGFKIPSNKIIHQQARSIDIFPTIIDLIKLDTLKIYKHAVTLSPLIFDESMVEPPAFLDGSKNAPKFINYDQVGVRTSEYKYFKNKYHDNDNYLFDLKNDPLEEYNVAKEKPDIVKKMDQLLLNFKGKNGFDLEKDIDLFDEEEERKIEEKLRKLGYM